MSKLVSNGVKLNKYNDIKNPGRKPWIFCVRNVTFNFTYVLGCECNLSPTCVLYNLDVTKVRDMSLDYLGFIIFKEDMSYG